MKTMLAALSGPRLILPVFSLALVLSFAPSLSAQTAPPRAADSGAAQVLEESLPSGVLDIHETAVSKGGHVALIGVRHEEHGRLKSFVVLDGQQIVPSGQAYWGLAFRGEHLTYKVGSQQWFTLFVDKQPWADTPLFFRTFSPDGEHLACATLKGATPERQGGKWTLELDGQKLLEFDNVKGRRVDPGARPSEGRKLVFAPGEKHLACAVWGGGGGCGGRVVTDVQQWPEIEAIAEIGSIALSPDGKHVAYGARMITGNVGTKWSIVIDERAGRPEFDAISSVVMSADGQHTAFAAAAGGQWFVVRDGQRGPGYGGIGTLAMSSDGKIVAYAALKGGKWFVITNEQAGPEVDRIDTFVMSPDGKLVACTAHRGGKWVVVMNGKAGPEFERLGTFVTSPDGTRVAYSASNADRWVVVTDGQPGLDYDWIRPNTLHFTGDSKHVVYPACQGEKWVVITDGKASPEYLDFALLTMNPNGKGFVYAAQEGPNRWRLVTDGQPGPVFNQIISMCFSPNGSRLAYVAVHDGQWMVVVDGTSHPANGPAASLLFSTDSKHLAYIENALNAGPPVHMVLDGQAGPAYPGIASGSMVFRPDGTLEYLATKPTGTRNAMANRAIYRIKQRTPAGSGQ